MKRLAAVLAALCGPWAFLAFAQFQSAAEHNAIAYTASAPTDAIAQLQHRIDKGEIRLDFDAEHGYLTSVLRALDVPVASQSLVFSKTSFQADRIGPWAPRALYFNDDVYIGEVRGSALLEIASVDPKLGAVFYTLDQRQDSRPSFQRQGAMCLQCHDSSSATGGVPGLLVRSVYPDRMGYVVGVGTDSTTTDRSPLAHRWGGWYVTGTHGADQHLGNLKAAGLAHELGNAQRYIASVQPGDNGNVTNLKSQIDTSRLLTPHSDIVALMVFAHQASLHNLMTSAGYTARISGFNDEARAAAERLVQALLFVNEAQFSGPIKGTSGFEGEFANRGPRDRQGRTLHEFDLKHRLFRYRMSYLIYSQQFDGLPSDVKDYVYRRLHDVLSGADQSAPFSGLAASERKVIGEILADTKPDFVAAAGR